MRLFDGWLMGQMSLNLSQGLGAFRHARSAFFVIARSSLAPFLIGAADEAIR
jgi:hypothetical protein